MSKPTYKFNPETEAAVIRQIVADPSVLPKFHRHLRADGFEAAESKTLVSGALAYFKANGRAPTWVALMQELRERLNAGRLRADDFGRCAAFLEEARERPPLASEYVVDLVLGRERSEALWLALEEGSKLHVAGARDAAKLDEIVRVVAKADAIGKVDRDMGVDVLDDLDARTRAREETKQPKRWGSGIPDLDDLMDGGPSADNPLGCVAAGPKQGKCHAKGQGILLADGSVRKVEDIRVGDRLMGPDGLPRVVLSTNQGRGEMYEVRPNRHEAPWRVNVDHILTLIGTGRAGHARYGDQVIDVSVRDWLGWSSKRKHAFKLWRAPIDRFHREAGPLLLDPYFLGVLLGDGSMKYTCVGVTTADAEVVAEVERQALRYGLRVKVTKGKAGAPTYYLSGVQGRRNPVMACLDKLGLRGRTCDDKFVPADYQLADRTARLALLAGLIDTDGAKALGGGYDYVTKSRRLADDVVFIARSLGLSARVRPCRKGCQGGFVGDYFRVHLFGDVGELPCRLARKVTPVDPMRRARRHRSSCKLGFTVARTRKAEPYYGFTLAGDGRYLLDDFTVTHNSLFLSHVALSTAALGGTAVYFSMENGKDEVLRRMDAAVSGIAIREVHQRAREVDSFVRRWWTEVRRRGGRLHVAKMPQRSTTVKDLEAYLDILAIEEGLVPDVVVTDYPKEMSPTNPEGLEKHEAQEEIYSELRSMADRRRHIGWTAAQLKAAGLEKRMAGRGDTGGALAIEQLVDVMVAIGRTPDEEKDHLARFGVSESRFCQSGTSTAPLSTAYDQGRILANFIPGLL